MVHRGLKYMAISLLIGCSGCGTDQSLIQPFITSLVEAQCRRAEATADLPDSVPADLAVIQADPATFAPSSYPLANVVVGTVLDDLSGLAGCWGRYTRQVFSGSANGQKSVAEEFAVLHFDIDGRVLTLHRYFTLPSADVDGSMARASQFLGAAVPSGPIFLTEVYAIASMSDNLLTLQGLSAEGAGVGQDGQPVFSCLAALGSEVNANTTLRMLVTRQGGFLKEYDEEVESNGMTSADDIVPADAEEFAELWVRFDRSAQQGQ